MAASEEGELLEGLGPCDRHACSVSRVLAFQLACGCQGIVLNDDRAEQHRAENGNGVLRAIRHDESDPVARAHTRLVEGAGASAHLMGKLCIRELAREKVDGCALRVARGNLQDHLRDGLRGGRDLVGNAGRVQSAQLRREVHLSSFGNGIPTIP